MNHRPGWPVRVYMLRSSWSSPNPQIGADAVGDVVAEQLAHQFFLALVAGRQHDQIGGDGLAVLHPRAFGDKAIDIGKLLQPDLALDDQVGAADVEIIAAAAGEIFELPAGVVLAEIELEADALQAVEQFLVELFRLLGQSSHGSFAPAPAASRSRSGRCPPACPHCRARRPVAPTARC